MTLVPLNTGA